MNDQKNLATLVSIQVGMPKQLTDEKINDKEPTQWFSGIFKSQVEGWVQVNKTQIQGDGQADTVQHGGIDKAILVYSADHFEDWSAQFDGRIVDGGMFGENLTVKGLNEAKVCIGDHYQIDEVTLEVSQPRAPCWKLGRRWSEKLLPKLVIQTARCGWYCRVVKTGRIKSGSQIELVNRIHPEWTIKRAHETLYSKSQNRDVRDELASLKELSAAWKADL